MAVCESTPAPRLAGTALVRFLPRISRYTPPRSVRLRQLDGLRGVAMLWVFLVHFGNPWVGLVSSGSSPAAFLRLLEADGSLGSSFFMLLSGFFSYTTLMAGRKGFRAFLRGRIARLYPLYFLMTGVYLAGSVLLPQMSKIPPRPLAAVAFIASNLLFLPGVFHIEALMEVSWTMSFIVLFYFVAGAITVLFRLCRLSRVEKFLFLILSAAIWAVAGHYTGWWQPRTNILWIGMALSEAVDAMSGARNNLATRIVALAASVALAGILLRTWLMMTRPDTGPIPIDLLRNLFTVTGLFAFAWVTHFGPDWWKRLLSANLLRQMGAASYSFYLTHGITVKIFRFGVVPLLGKAAGLPVVFWVCQILGLVMSVIVARIVFEYVENPIAAWVKPRVAVTPRRLHWWPEVSPEPRPPHPAVL